MKVKRSNNKLVTKLIIYSKTNKYLITNSDTFTELNFSVTDALAVKHSGELCAAIDLNSD